MRATKKISILGKKVHYWEQNPEGEATILFIHGNSGGKEVFKKQFSSQKLSSYRLMALDLPGHGENTHYDNAVEDHSIYTYGFYAEVINQFCKALELENLFLYGHSLGGHLAISAANDLDLKGLIISQTPPFNSIEQTAESFANPELLGTFYNPTPTNEEIENLLSILTNSSDLKDILREKWHKTDPQFKINFATSMGNLAPNEIDLIENYHFPVRLFESINDQAINTSYYEKFEFFSHRLIHFNRSLHYPQWEEADEVNEQLVLFIESNLLPSPLFKNKFATQNEVPDWMQN